MKRSSVVLAIVLIYAAVVRIVALDRPFEYDAEGSGSLNGVLARGYLRFEWRQHRGMPILSLDPAHATPIVFYPDHPPLVPLLIVPFYSRFGVGAWQTRLPISLMTLAAIVVLYRLLSDARNERAGLIAAAVFASTPMVLYFGGFPDVVGTPLIFFVLLTVWGYLRFHRSPGPRTFIPFAGAFVVAGICDWPAYVVVPIFTIHFLATKPRREWRWALAFALTACVLFATVYAYITLATHSPWTWMAPLFMRRSTMGGLDRLTLWSWLRKAIATNRTYHTLPVLIAASLWVAASGFRDRGSPAGGTVARLLLAWAALYVLIGARALSDHEWAWIPFTPGLAVAAALFADRVIHIGERRGAPTLATWSVVSLLVAFAAWTGRATLRDLDPAKRRRPFTPMEMGRAIQVAAPDRDNVALLVGGEEAEAQLWFYGDRALRTKIWSVSDFEHRVDDDTVDLVYNFDEQPWKARATGVVFPKRWRHDFMTLHDYLAKRHPLAKLPPGLEANFDVFDLRKKAGEAGEAGMAEEQERKPEPREIKQQ
jgi:hypothetical protein